MTTTLAAAILASCVPMRWPSADPKSLDLLAGTPVNCVLIEPEQWEEPFLHRARERGIAVLGLVQSEAAARRALELKLDGIAIEGDLDPPAASGLPVVRLVSRRALYQPARSPVIGTWQGVWPGLRLDEQEPVMAGPTTAPWLDTNSGFLRFLRATTEAEIWIGNTPPPGRAFPLNRYLEAIADAALAGARWIVALDQDFNQRLLARESKALKDWQQITALLRFIEDRREWRRLRPFGQLALVQDTAAGALVSGGLFDMIAVQHLPVRAIPPARLSPQTLEGIRVVINATGAMPSALREFERTGGVVASAPEGWRFPLSGDLQFAIRKADLPRLEPMWRLVEQATARRNLGVRVFNAASMLSAPLISEDGQRLVLLIANYTGYPAEAITVHALGAWRSARLHTPEHGARELKPYAVKDATAVEIERIGTWAAVELFKSEIF